MDSSTASMEESANAALTSTGEAGARSLASLVRLREVESLTESMEEESQGEC